MSASPNRRPLGDPRLAGRRSPWTRAVLATIVAATLPFLWSEDASCDAQPKPLISGFEILFGKHLDAPQPGLVFFGFLVVAVGLGFVVPRTERPWRRLAGEIVAGVAALGSALMCLLMITHGRPDQPLDRPAAWIGTLSAFALAFEVWWRAGEAVRLGIEQRRARKLRIGGAAGPRIAEGVEPAREPAQVEHDHDQEIEEERRAPRRRSI